MSITIYCPILFNESPRNPNPCPKISAKHVILHKGAGMRPAASVRTGRVKGPGVGFPILAGGPLRLPVCRSGPRLRYFVHIKKKRLFPLTGPSRLQMSVTNSPKTLIAAALLEIMRLTWQKPRVKRHLAT